MYPVDTLSAAPRAPLAGDAVAVHASGDGSLAALASRSFRAMTMRADAPSAVPATRPATVRQEVLVFSFRGMRFALPTAQVVEVMTLSGERWQRLLAMAAGGTLGASGLPLIRLATRMGLAGEAPKQGGLVLFGTGGRVRATVLIDDVPVSREAEVEAMPASWRSRFAPCGAMIGGIARLPDGAQAAMVELPIGVAAPRAQAASDEAHHTAHLLVRAGRSQLEAVRIASVQGAVRLDAMPGIALFPSTRRGPRVLLELGGDEAVTVDEVVGLAPRGRIERVGGTRVLATESGRYRLIEPSGTQPAPAKVLRVLVNAPEGAERMRLRAVVRDMGHEASLADDPRAARLAGGRFDVILTDLDAYADIRAGGVQAHDAARRIGFATDVLAPPAGFSGVVAAGDTVGLILALLHRAG